MNERSENTQLSSKTSNVPNTEEIWKVVVGAGWYLPWHAINDLQRQSVDQIIKRSKAAHFTNVKVRINGKWEESEADWIKHMVRIPVVETPERCQNYWNVHEARCLRPMHHEGECWFAAPSSVIETGKAFGALPHTLKASVGEVIRDVARRSAALIPRSEGGDGPTLEINLQPMKASEQRPGHCVRQPVAGDPCDRDCNWPECGCVCGPDGIMTPAVNGPEQS